jgi:PAS domain-containing protein
MVEHTSANAPARDWRLVMMAGGASFAVSYGLFHYIFPVGRWVTTASAPVASLVLSATIACLAMTLTLAVLSRLLRTDNQRMRVAINNMSQGLCMFDGNERLVVCNQRYMEMYKVSGDVVKPGITLQNLLKYRISNGSFTHDPVAYRRDLVGAMSAGKPAPKSSRRMGGQ